MKIKGIFLRGGVYYFRQQIGHKRVAVSLGTGDLGDAVKLAIEKKGELHSRQDSSMFTRIADDFLAYCDKSLGIRRKSLANYTWATTRAKKYWEGTKLQGVTKKECEAFLKAMEKEGYSNISIHVQYRVLHRFFNWCVQEKILKAAPTVGISLPKKGSKINRKPFCTVDQRKKLLEGCGENEDMKFILFCGFCAGLRKLEISEARRDWFNLEKGYLHVQKAEGWRLRRGEKPYRIKDAEERTVPLTKEFLEYLTFYLVGLEPLDFPLHPEVKHGRTDYRYNFERPFARYVEEQGMKWVTPHTMRRTFASLLVQAGVSITKVAMWLGDDVAITERHYSFLNQDDSDINRGF